MQRKLISLAFGALISSSLPALAADPIKLEVGISGAATDVGFFIADKKGYFKAEGIDHLDRVVLSHPDMDHIGGYQAIQRWPGRYAAASEMRSVSAKTCSV